MASRLTRLPLWAIVACYGLAYIPLILFPKLVGATVGVLAVTAVTVFGSAATWLVLLIVCGWWRSARAGMCKRAIAGGLVNTIIQMSTIGMYGAPTGTVLLPALLTKAGANVMAGSRDLRQRRRPSRRDLAVLGLCSVAFLIPFIATFGAIAAAPVPLVCAGLYLFGYGLKLPIVDAARDHQDGVTGTWNFLAAEITVTSVVSLLIGLVLACLTPLHIMAALAKPLLWGAGAASASVGLFNGLLLMRKGQINSRLVPLSKSASFLAGLASAVLMCKPVPGAEKLASAIMLIALGVGTK